MDEAPSKPSEVSAKTLSEPVGAPAAPPALRRAAPVNAPRAKAAVAQPAPSDPLGMIEQQKSDGAKAGGKRDEEKKLAGGAIPKLSQGANGFGYRPPLARALSRCSDVAARPLSERLVLWQKRARKSTNAMELSTIYDQAYAACELPDWRDEAALLDIVQQRIDTEQGAEIVLGHFASFPEGQRYVAKNLVAAGLADRCEIQVSYAIGVAEPTSITVETFGTGRVNQDRLEQLVRAHFDLRPYGIVKMLDLVHPMYRRTAAYGHFGREPVHMTYKWEEQIGDKKVEKSEAFTAFTWEKTDKAEALRKDARL